MDAEKLFNQFFDADSLQEVLSSFRDLCWKLGLQDTHYGAFYPALKKKLAASAPRKWTELRKLLDERASMSEYDKQNSCVKNRICIIGAGPVGLRTAVEAALLGAKVDVLEKRTTFSRNNVLKLWQFMIADLKKLGAKRLYPRFCFGTIEHISIRILQFILLKICLLLGVKVHDGVEFCHLLEPSDDKGWMIETKPPCDASQHQYDVIIEADSRKYTLPGFQMKQFKPKLAIAITVNFVNHNTTPEAMVEEFGESRTFRQQFFKDLDKAYGIDLENILYLKDATHYFVMTAKKHSLLKRGVLLQDKSDTSELLSKGNVDSKALMAYARDAAQFGTKGKLCVDEFVINDNGVEDVDVFDFTSLYAATHASRIVERRGKRLLMCLVGDSLYEPFWPTGTGGARGFLSAFDAAWMMKRFAADVDPLELLKEREAIYLLLPNITIEKNYAAFTIDPATRYPASALKGLVPHVDVSSLYDNGTDSIQGVKNEQDELMKEPIATHTSSNHDSTSVNCGECLCDKSQSSIAVDYKTVPNDDTSHFSQRIAVAV